MDIQAAIDRILEAENLTDALEDEDASQLINWGIEKVPGLLVGLDNDDEAAGNKINQLMADMRLVNQAVGDRQALPVDKLASLITKLREQYIQTTGISKISAVEESPQLAKKISKQPANEALQTLLNSL